MNDKNLRAEFDRIALPHIDAAYNLARWLTRHDHDAEDIVQEAFLRAYRHFHSFNGGTGRAWMLQIVRNTCLTWLSKKRVSESGPATLDGLESPGVNPASVLEHCEERQMLMQAIEGLPVEFREVIVLRELEGLSYKEISRIAEVPLGTVMSRLARARERLHEMLDRKLKGEEQYGLP